MKSLLNAVVVLCLMSMGMMGCCIVLDQKPQVAAVSPVDPLENAYKSVVELNTKAKGEPGALVATGWSLDKDRIMTAGHYCVGTIMGQLMGQLEEDITMTYINNNDELVTVGGLTIEAVDESMDLCVLKKRRHGLVPLPLVKDYSTVKTRSKVFVIGAPVGVFPVETEGRVIRAKSEGFPIPVLNNRLFMSAPAYGGNSGGPVLNEKGEVIGVLVMKVSEYEHISVATHADMIRHFFVVEKIKYGK